MSFLTIPPSLTRFRLTNARVPVCLVADSAQLKADADGFAPCDIVIENGRIPSIDSGAQDDLPHFDLDRGIDRTRSLHDVRNKGCFRSELLSFDPVDTADERPEKIAGQVPNALAVWDHF